LLLSIATAVIVELFGLVLFNNTNTSVVFFASPWTIPSCASVSGRHSRRWRPAGSFQNFRSNQNLRLLCKKIGAIFPVGVVHRKRATDYCAESSAGRPVAIDKLPSGLLRAGAQGVVRAVDFQNGKPASRAPSAAFRLAGSDIVSAQ